MTPATAPVRRRGRTAVRVLLALQPLLFPLAILLVVLLIPLLVILLIVMMIAGSGGADAAPTQAPGIHATMLSAYTSAARRTPTVAPNCTGMRWSILAAIAKIESSHAAGRDIDPGGTITPPILGPRLNGSGVGGNHTPVRDTDGGALDGDTAFDRAVGPFQFLPSTWKSMGRDGNDDGDRNPNNAFDAALGAVVHLCGTQPRNLTDRSQLSQAIFGYNRSQHYVTTVQTWIATYDALQLTPPAGAADTTGPAKTVIEAAMAQQGVPYAWGGGTAAGPSKGQAGGGPAAAAHGDQAKIGFDCSGLTLYAYAKVSIALPHSSKAQFTLGTPVPREGGLGALRPADLVFYGPGLIHHVGIYLGDGKMINAPYSGTQVRIDPLDISQYAGGRRLLA